MKPREPDFVILSKPREPYFVILSKPPKAAQRRISGRVPGQGRHPSDPLEILRLRSGFAGAPPQDDVGGVRRRQPYFVILSKPPKAAQRRISRRVPGQGRHPSDPQEILRLRSGFAGAPTQDDVGAESEGGAAKDDVAPPPRWHSILPLPTFPPFPHGPQGPLANAGLIHLSRLSRVHAVRCGAPWINSQPLRYPVEPAHRQHDLSLRRPRFGIVAKRITSTKPLRYAGVRA